MQSDHQMARMGQSERPVPRFEIVHTPRVDGTIEEDAVNRQPWHARFIGANGEPVWWTESYADVRDAEHAIDLIAEALGSQALFEGVKAKKDAPRPGALAIVRVEVGP